MSTSKSFSDGSLTFQDFFLQLFPWETPPVVECRVKPGLSDLFKDLAWYLGPLSFLESRLFTYLISDVFEPLNRASFKQVTEKAVFLLALASAGRVSEWHALSVESNYLHFQTDGSIQLLKVPLFLAKNLLPHMNPQPIVIQSWHPQGMMIQHTCSTQWEPWGSICTGPIL